MPAIGARARRSKPDIEWRCWPFVDGATVTATIARSWTASQIDPPEQHPTGPKGTQVLSAQPAKVLVRGGFPVTGGAPDSRQAAPSGSAYSLSTSAPSEPFGVNDRVRCDRAGR